MSRIALLASVLLLGILGASCTALGTDHRHQSLRSHSATAESHALDLRSSYASQGTVSLSASAGVNETSFAATLCDSIAANAPVTSLSITGLLDSSGVPYFTLPSCVYDISGTLTSMSLANWLVNGTTSNPDPLTLLGPMFGSVTTFSANTVNFYGPQANSLAQVNWTNFISTYMASVNQITLVLTRFNGSLPTSLPTSCSYFFCDTVSFSGTIPSTLLPVGTSSFELTVTSTLLTGGFPNGFFANVGSNAQLTITFQSNNFITGSIGSNFLSGTNMTSMSEITLVLSQNPSLSGTIPTDLWGLPNACAATYIYIDVGYTNISAFSKTFLSTYSFPNLSDLSIHTLYSAIKGDLPSRIMPLSAPNLASYTFYNDGNVMGGTVPTAFIGNIASWTGGRSPYTFLTLWLRYNQLTGIVTFPAAPSQTLGSGPYTLFKFAGQNNNFTYMNIQPTASRYLTDIEIGYSPGSRGTLDNVFSPSAIDSYLDVVDFANCSISGTMPDLNTMNTEVIKWLSLSYTPIDFCSNTSRSPWTGSSALNTCLLQGTNAYMCPELYPNCEISAPAPSAPTSPPSSTPTCLDSTKPDANFVCVDGIWVNLESSTTPTLVITTSGTSSSGSTSQVLVLGNVTSSTLVYQNLGTTLVVGGCADNVSSITIELSDEDLQRITNSTGSLRQQLLAIQGDNCSDLATVKLSTSTTNSTCSAVSSSTESTNGQLFALFSITGSSCSNKKEQKIWIIIVPAVCGGVLLIVIIVVIVVACCSCAKKAVRPYAGADPHSI